MNKIISRKVKKSVTSSVVEAFKNTDLDDDRVWKEVFKKKSRNRRTVSFFK